MDTSSACQQQMTAMKPTQTAAIRAHLESGKTITHKQAEKLFECTRVAARVNDLIHKKGLNIVNLNAGSKKPTFAEYFLMP